MTPSRENERRRPQHPPFQQHRPQCVEGVDRSNSIPGSTVCETVEGDVEQRPVGARKRQRRVGSDNVRMCPGGYLDRR